MVDRNTQIEIRKATSDDTADIWNVRTRAISISCQGHYPDNLISMWASSSMPEGFPQTIADTEFFVAEGDGQILGFGFLDKHTARIEAIFVDPSYQRSGIGSRLLQLLESTARQAGLGLLTLSSTLNAVPFYQRAGFEPQSTSIFHHPNGFDLDCVVMEKIFTPNRGSA